MQQDELVIILLIGEATGGIRQVVVVGNDQMFAVDHIHIFDGHEGEGELAVLAATLGDALRIVDVHQVDMPDLLDEAFGVDIGQTDLVDTLEFGRYVLAIRACRAIAGVLGQPFAVVALDDQAGIGVDHVEITDIVAVLLQQILP